MGYYRVGFEVVGVDKKPQRHYPFTFIQADALQFLELIAPQFDHIAAVHASPPCQHYANVTKWRGSASDHPDLLEPTRDALEALGLPYVIENVPEAPLKDPLVLCGSSFGLEVKRHRGFELSGFSLPPVPCGSHEGLRPFMHKYERAYADAMGCTWMSGKEAREAIPPAYTEHIGRGLLTVPKTAA